MKARQPLIWMSRVARGLRLMVGQITDNLPIISPIRYLTAMIRLQFLDQILCLT